MNLFQLLQCTGFSLLCNWRASFFFQFLPWRDLRWRHICRSVSKYRSHTLQKWLRMWHLSQRAFCESTPQWMHLLAVKRQFSPWTPNCWMCCSRLSAVSNTWLHTLHVVGIEGSWFLSFSGGLLHRGCTFLSRQRVVVADAGRLKFKFATLRHGGRLRLAWDFAPLLGHCWCSSAIRFQTAADKMFSNKFT